MSGLLGNVTKSSLEDDGSSTSSPEIIEEAAIGSVVIIVIVAVLTIAGLFGMAIFIDCRHQKLMKKKGEQNQSVKSLMRWPIFTRRHREDEEVITEDMEGPETAPPHQTA